MPMTDGRRAQRLLGFIFTPVYQPDCSSDPQRCLCSVMSTADWSRRGNVLYDCNVTERRGESKERTRGSGECSVQSESP